VAFLKIDPFEFLDLGDRAGEMEGAPSFVPLLVPRRARPGEAGASDWRGGSPWLLIEEKTEGSEIFLGDWMTVALL